MPLAVALVIRPPPKPHLSPNWAPPLQLPLFSPSNWALSMEYSSIGEFITFSGCSNSNVQKERWWKWFWVAGFLLVGARSHSPVLIFGWPELDSSCFSPWWSSRGFLRPELTSWTLMISWPFLWSWHSSLLLIFTHHLDVLLGVAGHAHHLYHLYFIYYFLLLFSLIVSFFVF